MIVIPEWGSLGVFVAAALLLLVTPGPAVLYIVARSVDQGRAAGLVSALGVHAGTLVHIGAAAAGLSVLLAASATLFTLVKYLGAAYLVFLGVRRLLDRTRLGGPGQARAIPWRRAFLDGAIVNVLNPKTALFFLAFLPQFVDPARGSVGPQVLALGLVSGLLRFPFELHRESIPPSFDAPSGCRTSLGSAAALFSGRLHPIVRRGWRLRTL